MTDNAASPASAPARPHSEKIRLVCATRLSNNDFFASSALGRSLPHYRTFPRGQYIELRLFANDAAPLPTVYNQFFEEAMSTPAIHQRSTFDRCLATDCPYNSTHESI